MAENANKQKPIRIPLTHDKRECIDLVAHVSGWTGTLNRTTTSSHRQNLNTEENPKRKKNENPSDDEVFPG